MAAPIVGVWVKLIGQAAMEEAAWYAADQFSHYTAHHGVRGGLRYHGRVLDRAMRGKSLKPTRSGVARARFRGATLRGAKTVIDLARGLHDPSKAGAEAIGATLATVMQPVEDDIRENTPVGKTGRLKNSVATKVSVYPSKTGPGYVIRARTGWLGANAPPRAVQYAVEYGSRRRGRKGLRIIRNAVRRHKDIGMSDAYGVPLVVHNQIEAHLAAIQEEWIHDRVLIGQTLFGSVGSVSEYARYGVARYELGRNRAAFRARIVANRARRRESGPGRFRPGGKFEHLGDANRAVRDAAAAARRL